jgi:hypothetical protein
MKIIKTGWHKATDKFAATTAQLRYIAALQTEENLKGFEFSSKTQAMRSLTKSDASAIIEALKDGDTVILK